MSCFGPPSHAHSAQVPQKRFLKPELWGGFIFFGFSLPFLWQLFAFLWFLSSTLSSYYVRITILSLGIFATALCLEEIYYPEFFYMQGTEAEKQRVKSAAADLFQCYPRKKTAVENCAYTVIKQAI